MFFVPSFASVNLIIEVPSSFLLFLIVSSFLPDRLPWHIQRVTSHMLLTLLRRWEFKLWYAKAKLSVALLKKTGKGGSWSSMLNGRRGCSSWCANAVFLQQKKLAHHMLLPITRVHTWMLLLAVTLSSKQYIPGVCRMELIPKWSNDAVFLQNKPSIADVFSQICSLMPIAPELGKYRQLLLWCELPSYSFLLECSCQH